MSRIIRRTLPRVMMLTTVASAALVLTASRTAAGAGSLTRIDVPGRRRHEALGHKLKW
jgi:hypothetical protein